MKRNFTVVGCSSKPPQQKQLPAAPIQTKQLSSFSYLLSSRPALGGGGNLDTQAGSSGEGTQNYPHAANVIQFLPRAVPSNCEPSQVRSFIQDDDLDSGMACVLAVLVGFFATAIGVGLYLGSLFFNFFDLG